MLGRWFKPPWPSPRRWWKEREARLQHEDKAAVREHAADILRTAEINQRGVLKGIVVLDLTHKNMPQINYLSISRLDWDEMTAYAAAKACNPRTEVVVQVQRWFRGPVFTVKHDKLERFGLDEAVE